MTDTLAERRNKALLRLRRAQARLLPLEVEQRQLQELVTALSRRMDLARRRVAAVSVTSEELRSHENAALRLGEAQRRLLHVINERRALDREVTARTEKLARPGRVKS